jgi:hypothetical protein
MSSSLFLGMVCLSLTAFAAPSSLEQLTQAEAQIKALNEESAVEILEKLLAEPHLAPADTARAYLLLGLAHGGLANEEKAVESFRTARGLSHSLSLPPKTPPRVVQWWERAAPPLPPAPSQSPAVTGLGKAGDLPAPQNHRPPWLRHLAWGLTGSSLVAAGVGAGFGVDARAAYAQARQQEWASEAEPLFHRAHGEAHTANLLFGVAATTAVAGLVCWLLAPPAATSTP